MTDQHRATPEQWADQEKWASPPDADPYALCLLEIRARVEALEKAQRQPSHDKLDRLIAHDSAENLVERVADVLCNEFSDETPFVDLARAAIREVAAALIDWHDSDQLVHTAWEAAKWLEQKAKG